MKLLVISPDYASHVLPLTQVAKAWQASQGEVVVATGTATRAGIEDAGLAWTELHLGKGSNAGVIEASEQPAGEDEHLRAFFRATREGPVATLRYQAESRRHDLMHEPDRVLDRLRDILRAERPARVLVDHVAFGARLALHALGIDPATIVLGHPTALPAPGEVYGLPPEWPVAMRPSDAELATLRRHCARATSELGAGAQELLLRRGAGRDSALDLTALPGWPTLYVYPEALHDPARPLPRRHVFLGALARREELGSVQLPSGPGPRITVALGSFLSARGDVLATAVRAARQGGWRLALAHGSTPLDELGPLPAGALVARHLPQVALLAHTDVLVTHGGNGSVTEAVLAGVPMVVLPFSTDQFAAAAAIERTGFGRVLAPNTLTAEQLIVAVESLRPDAAACMAKVLGASDAGGADRAVRALVEQGRPPRSSTTKPPPNES